MPVPPFLGFPEHLMFPVVCPYLRIGAPSGHGSNPRIEVKMPPTYAMAAQFCAVQVMCPHCWQQGTVSWVAAVRARSSGANWSMFVAVSCQDNEACSRGSAATLEIERIIAAKAAAPQPVLPLFEGL